MARVPVVATNVGSNPEFIRHQSSGLLFMNEDENDLASQLQLLVDNPRLITKMSKNTKHQKSIALDAKNIIRHYQGLLKL